MSVELGQRVFADNLSKCCTSIYDCYKLIRSLQGNSEIPNICRHTIFNSSRLLIDVKWLKRILLCVLVYDQAKFEPPDIVGSSFDEINISLSDVANALSKESRGVVYDNIPCARLRECSNELSAQFLNLQLHISCMTVPRVMENFPCRPYYGNQSSL